MFAIAVGVLVVAALGAAGLAQKTSSDAAIRDLRSKSTTIGSEVEAVSGQLRTLFGAGKLGFAREACRLIGTTLAISGGSLVSIRPDGSVQPGVSGIVGARCARVSGVTSLPKNLTTSDLNPEALLAGETQTGVHGGTAFLAEPLTANAARTPVLILTQTVETRPLGRAGPYLIGTGAFALFLAAIVSFILARRLTEPIAAMQSTAGRIAAGDLSARVGKVAGPNDELAGLARSIDGMADDLETARGAERSFLHRGASARAARGRPARPRAPRCPRVLSHAGARRCPRRCRCGRAGICARGARLGRDAAAHARRPDSHRRRPRAPAAQRHRARRHPGVRSSTLW